MQLLATAVADPHPQELSTVPTAVREEEEILILAFDDAVLPRRPRPEGLVGRCIKPDHRDMDAVVSGLREQAR